MIANLETLQQKLIADCHAEVNAAAGAQGRQ
jgi:hypothetical protein